MTSLLFQFIAALFATCGFCIIFHVPISKIPVCVLIGAFGWTTYKISMFYYASPVAACFFASCMVGFLSDVASRLCKEASTIFIIPGILCLVPGSNIYYTMLSLVQHDTNGFADNATVTLTMAGAIAAGLLVMGSIIQVIRSMMKKTLPTIKKQ